MDEYFVRVYHMKDGTVQEIRAMYAIEEQAMMALGLFNPNGDEGITPEEDIKQVAYVTIEKRYAPKGTVWSPAESQCHAEKRAQKYLEYLDRLSTLKSAGIVVTSEIQATLSAINQELGLEVDR